MPRSRKPPTVKTIRATLTKLLREVATVYESEGRIVLTKTNEHGSMRVEWKDGRMMLEEKPDA